MPFVAHVRPKVEEFGIKALSRTCEVDEVKVLNININYLRNTLGIEFIDIKYSDEGDESMREECCPGKPFIMYNRINSSTVGCINPEIGSGCFEISKFPVFNNESVKNVTDRISNAMKYEGSKRIKLMRCKDNDNLYSLNNMINMYDGKINIDSNSKFVIDEGIDKIRLKENGNMINIVSPIFYIFE